jgi:hypothetical protein
MDMHPVASSLISHLGYDAETETLAVCFIEGERTYYYPGVPQVIYEGLRQAPSVGKHFGRHVRGYYSGILQPTEEDDRGAPDRE